MIIDWDELNGCEQTSWDDDEEDREIGNVFGGPYFRKLEYWFLRLEREERVNDGTERKS